MKTHAPAPAEQTQQHKQQSTQTSAQLFAQPQATFEDARPEAAQLRRLQSMMAASPQQQKMQALQAKMAAGSSVQRMEDEELLQGKFATVQRIEDEELLQGKFETVQRMEDEELLQGKFETAQLMAEEEPLQGKFSEAATAQLAEKPNNTGLPNQLKAGIESLSGMSMDHVKVHYNSDKPAQLNAHAYAQGSDIHVAAGQEQHLPHEAWHVVQQAQGRVKPTVQMKGGVPVNDDVGLETEADVMGAKALAACINESAQIQPFQFKKEGTTIVGTAQMKKVWYGSATQRGAEGKTHHGKTIHYLSKHGSGVTDDFQSNRLLGQERAFITVKANLLVEANTSKLALTESIAEFTKAISKMDPKHEKFVQKQKQLDTAIINKATTIARIAALTAIIPGSTEMFVEMGGPKRKKYSDELKKPANFGAGTPTKIVTNFAENDTTMLSMAGQMVDSMRGELEAVVGEAGQSDTDKKGIITKEGPINSDFKKHTLSGPGTVTVETVRGEPKNASFSFVAQEVQGVLPENVADPVTLLVESGYIRP